MSKKYVCELDGSIFSSEDELIQHLRNNFVKEFTDKTTDVSEVYDVLNKHYPNWKIRVVNGAGWYAGYIIYLENGTMQIVQHFENDKSKEDRCYTSRGNPETFEDLLKEIDWKMETAARITEKISKIGEFEEIYCKEFDYGYSPDEHHFTFNFKLKGWDDYSCDSYYPWGDKNDEDYFVNDFRKLFVKSIEGEIDSSYDRGHFEGYTIDGICINDLIFRAKRARLEILE